MTNKIWHKAAELDELPDGRVKQVSCGLETICLTHFKGKYGALDNKCPHQGGPLGEGSIEGEVLRCPWHGWDFDPLTGKPPGGYDDGVATYELEIRDDGIYVAVEEEEQHVPTTSDVLAQTMVNWGVDSVFGMVGHSNLGMADALRRQSEIGKINYYGIRHEGAAAFAASAYGKLTGRPAACFAIAGPGATNLLTGLWDAHVDSAPVLAITGQVPSKLIGRGAFQEVDLVGAFGKVAVWSAQTSATSPHGELMTLACKHAILDGGVSHLVLPDEVQNIEAPEEEAGSPEGRMPARDIAPPQSAVDDALQLLKEAKRPVIVVGHGARFAMEAVTKLAEELSCPVITTFKAKGQISDSHANACGVLGRSGTPIASWFMNECDLMLVFGASFSNHTGITPKKPIIQIDFEAAQLGRFHPVAVPLLGEVERTAKIFLEAVSGKHAATDQKAEIAERWKIWRAEKLSRSTEKGDGANSAAVFAALSEVAPDNAIIAVDVGNNTYSFGRYFECKNNAVLMSGYLGSIGFGYPAAMGAWAATQGDDPRFQGRPVIAVTGDGGFGQYLAEVQTAVLYKMNITHVLLNNGELGKISKEQRAGNWPVWKTELHNLNFAEYAQSCGALGIRVTSNEGIKEAMQKALDHDGPSMVEILTDALLI